MGFVKQCVMFHVLEIYNTNYQCSTFQLNIIIIVIIKVYKLVVCTGIYANELRFILLNNIHILILC